MSPLGTFRLVLPVGATLHEFFFFTDRSPALAHISAHRNRDHHGSARRSGSNVQSLCRPGWQPVSLSRGLRAPMPILRDLPQARPLVVRLGHQRILHLLWYRCRFGLVNVNNYGDCPMLWSQPELLALALCLCLGFYLLFAIRRKKETPSISKLKKNPVGLTSLKLD